MTLTICTKCLAHMDIPPEYLDQPTKCVKCGQIFTAKVFTPQIEPDTVENRHKPQPQPPLPKDMVTLMKMQTDLLISIKSILVTWSVVIVIFMAIHFLIHIFS